MRWDAGEPRRPQPMGRLGIISAALWARPSAHGVGGLPAHAAGPPGGSRCHRGGCCAPRAPWSQQPRAGHPGRPQARPAEPSVGRLRTQLGRLVATAVNEEAAVLPGHLGASSRALGTPTDLRALHLRAGSARRSAVRLYELLDGRKMFPDPQLRPLQPQWAATCAEGPPGSRQAFQGSGSWTSTYPPCGRPGLHGAAECTPPQRLPAADV